MTSCTNSKKLIGLPQQAIVEFCEIYRKEFGVVLENDIAFEKANRVLGLFRILVQSEGCKT